MKQIRKVERSLDAIDRAILKQLSANSRLSVRELSALVGLSAPSTAERLRILEDRGAIDGYSIRIDPRAVGLPLAVHIRLRPMPGELRRVTQLLADTPEVVEADRITGDDCFVAKAYVASVDSLEALIDRFIPYATTNTAVVQSSPVRYRLPALP